MIWQPRHANDDHGYYKPGGYQALTVSTSVVSPTIPAGTRMAKVYFRDHTVRMRMDGTNPNGTTGIQMHDGYEEFYSKFELAAMKLIRDSTETQDATVHFQYYV
jgi:hypothetical protein